MIYKVGDKREMIKNILETAIGNKRIEEWETLTPDDAGEGDFVTLSSGARMHYIARGHRGDPVILIHGLMDSAYHWSKNIDALAQAHRVWAVDLIGFGFSSRITEPTYSLKNFARGVCEFLDAQKITRASVAGHSLGGAIALQLAHDFPERVDKLILIDPAAYWKIPDAVRFAARVPYVPRALASLAVQSQRAREVAWRGALGDPSHFDAREMAKRTRHLRVKGTVDALVAMTASPRATDLPKGLKRIAAPALIIWGEKDLVLPKQHGKRLTRDLSNARLVVVKNAGHIPNAEYPAAVNSLMIEFLRG